MLELRTLGLLDLRGPPGTDCDAVQRQPKRLALLAFLAAASPRRFHRRDVLLATFWPELDMAHARAALRRSLYFLRQALGDTVIESRGDEEVAVSAAALWCDAVAFDAALAAGHLEQALELYRGDLLEGVFLSGAPAFEHWLDGERAGRRAAAAGAAWRLAETAEQSGRIGEAIGWARRAAQLAPLDEDALRRLLLLLDRFGERPAALQAYDDFARRLAADYEIEPSAETRRIVERIRQGDALRPDRSAVGAYEADETPLEPSAGVIAVLPFTVRGAADLAYLSDGMVDLLGAQLDGVGGARVIVPATLLRFVGERGGEAGDDLRPLVSARFGAGRFVTGSLVEGRGRLQISATLSDERGTTLASASAEGDGEAGLFAVVDEIARRLLAALSPAPHARIAELAARTTASLPALRHWLAGETAFRLSRYFEAIDAFQRAVAEDPTFALAFYRLAAALAGAAMPEAAREAAAAAQRNRERLSEHARLLLDAQRAWLAGSVSEAEDLYSVVTGMYPDDVEAWFLLGDLLFHTNPMRGRSLTESRHAFSRALAFDGTHVSALGHLVRIAALEGERDEAEARIGRLLALSPDGDQALAMRALRASLVRDEPAQEAVLEELVRARVLTVANAFAYVSVYAGDLAGADRIAHRFVEEARNPGLRALCHVMRAYLAVTDGRPGDAATMLEQAAEHDAALAVETRGFMAVLPFAEVPRSEIDAARTALEAIDAAAVPPTPHLPLAMHNDLHPHLRAYLLAHLAARLDDEDECSRHAAALDVMPVPDHGTTLAWNLARSAESRVHVLRGDPAAALSALEQVRSDIWFQLTVASPFHAHALERFLRAELLADAGRTDAALGWYGAVAERSPFELPFRAAARERMTRLVQG